MAQGEEVPAFVQLSKEDEAAIERELRASFPEDEGLVKEVLATLSTAGRPSDADVAKVYDSTACVREPLITGPTLQGHTFTGHQAKGEGAGSGGIRIDRPVELNRLIRETRFYHFFYLVKPHLYGILMFYPKADKMNPTGMWVGLFPENARLQRCEGPGAFN